MTTNENSKPGYALQYEYRSKKRYPGLRAYIGPGYVLYSVRSICELHDLPWNDVDTDVRCPVRHRILVSDNADATTLTVTQEGLHIWLDDVPKAQEFLRCANTEFVAAAQQIRAKHFKGKTASNQIPRLMRWLVQDALQHKKARKTLNADKLRKAVDRDEGLGSVTEFTATLNAYFGGKVTRTALYDVFLHSGCLWRYWPTSGYGVADNRKLPYFYAFHAEDDDTAVVPSVMLTQRGRQFFADQLIKAYIRIAGSE